jgi:hypothetical protein
VDIDGGELFKIEIGLVLGHRVQLWCATCRV